MSKRKKIDDINPFDDDIELNPPKRGRKPKTLKLDENDNPTQPKTQNPKRGRKRKDNPTDEQPEEDETAKRIKINDTTEELRQKLELLKQRKAEIEASKQRFQKKYEEIRQKAGKEVTDIAEVLTNPDDYIEFPKHNIKIPKFDMSKLNTNKEGQRVGIFGMTGSGKSYLAIDIMRHNRSIPYWIILSGFVNPSF